MFFGRKQVAAAPNGKVADSPPAQATANASANFIPTTSTPTPTANGFMAPHSEPPAQPPSFAAVFPSTMEAPAAAAPLQDASVLQQQVAELRSRVQATVGQLVTALGSVPRYRHFTLGDIQSLLVEPLIRERLLIASPRTGTAVDDVKGPVAAVAFWASVSPEVDQKIREQIKTGVFPIRLAPNDWTSGDTVWILDLVAPSKDTATSVLAHFATTVEQPTQINIHPVVAKQVDPEMLRRG